MKEIENAIRTARTLLDEASRIMRTGEGTRADDISALAGDILREQSLCSVLNPADLSFDIRSNTAVA